MTKAILTSLAAGLSLGSAMGDVRYIWNRSGTSANWNTQSLWLMDDGTTASDYPNSTDAVVVFKEDRGAGLAGLMPNNQQLYVSLKELRLEGCGGKWGKVDSETDDKIACSLTYQGYLKFAAGGGVFFPDIPKRSPQGLYYYLSTVPGCQGEGEVVFDIPGNVEMNFDKPDVYHPAADANSPVLVKRGEGLLCIGNGTGKPNVAIKVEEGTLRMVFAPTSKDVAYPLIFSGDNAKVTIDKRSGAVGGLYFGTGYLSETDAVTGGRHSIDSQYGSVLGFYGAAAVATQTFSGCLTGNVSFEFKPSVAGREFVFTKGVSTTKGVMTVASGTLRVTDNASFPNVPQVTANAGNLAIDEDGQLAFPKATVLLYNGAKIVPGSGRKVALASVSSSNVAIAAGVYKAIGSACVGTEANWVGGDGTGVVIVGKPAQPTAVPCTWNGGAGKDNLNTSALANWNGASTLPDLTSGTASITLTDGVGLRADTDISVKGFTVNCQDNVQIIPCAGKTMRLGSGGLVDSTHREVYFGAPDAKLIVTADQVWDAKQGWVVLNGPIESEGNVQLKILGVGASKLRLTDAQPNWRSPLLAQDMLVQFEKTGGLGPKDAPAAVIVHKGEGNSPTIQDGVTVHRPLILVDGSKTGGTTSLVIPANAQVAFDGSLVSSNNTTLAINVGAGAKVTFGDLFMSRGNGEIRGSGTIVFNGPYHCRDRFYNYSSATIELHATGNRFNGNMGKWEAGTIKAMVPYAFAAENTKRESLGGSADGDTRTCIYMSGDAVLDLCGNDQSFGDMLTRGNAVITSATPATYYMVFTAGAAPYDGAAKTRSDQAVYSGAVNYSKWGKLPRWFMAESVSTGVVEVAEGTLTFTSATGGQVNLSPESATATMYDRSLGSWKKASAAVIKGGTLVLEHSQALGKKTDVRFDKMNNAYGKMQLNEGVSQMVHDLYVDGVKQPYGTYGSTSSSAQYKDDTRFAGSGVLNVVGTLGGAIIVR